MSTLKSRPFLILIAGFLVLFIGGGARLAIGLTLKPMVEELGWGRSELGVTVAVFQVVTAIAMFYAGKIADTMSLRLVLGGGVALGGVTIGIQPAVCGQVGADLLLEGDLLVDAHAASVVAAFRTSICPVTAAEIRAERRSCRRAMAESASATSVSA